MGDPVRTTFCKMGNIGSTMFQNQLVIVCADFFKAALTFVILIVMKLLNYFPNFYINSSQIFFLENFEVFFHFQQNCQKTMV